MEYTVEKLNGEIKIRDYLKGHLGFSTSLIAKVKYGGVAVNGNAVTMRATVKNGDKITVRYPEEDSECILPMDIPLCVLYEDEYLLAVDKPINMPVHPSRGNSLPTLANAVRAYIGHPFVFRAVNRLDRDTSGIVIIAKSQLAAAALSDSLKRGEFEKKYLARVVGTPSISEGEIDAPIERESEGSMRRTVRADGKRAVTKYRVVKSEADTSLVELTLITGRTHQIRVHMAHIGHPLVADFLYGERSPDKTYELRCNEISFPHPKSKQKLTIKA